MINPFDWIYEVGKIVEDEKKKRKLANTVRVGDANEAIKLMSESDRNAIRRFRCERDVGIVDEEWYDPKTGTWI